MYEKKIMNPIKNCKKKKKKGQTLWLTPVIPATSEDCDLRPAQAKS
jgi:hypothetical protein